MDSQTPKVTVLMAVYNGELFLREAIESILSQTFRDFEFLIINDGSTDGTRDILLSYYDTRIRLVHNEQNIGLTKSLNRGLGLARGVYVARQDADDISLPRRLEKQVTFLDEHTDVVILGTQAENIDRHGNVCSRRVSSKASSELAIRWQLLFSNPIIHTSVMFHSAVVRQHGGYDECFASSQDFELWSRLLYNYGVRNLKEVLVRYRVYNTAASTNYSTESIIKTKDVFRQIFINCMKFSPPPEWVDMWIAITNPYILDDPVDINKLINFVNYVNDHFFIVYPEARQDLEIKQLISIMLLEITINATIKDRLGSVRCFFWALGKDLPRTFRMFPKYFVALILGRNRRYFSSRNK